MTGLFFWLLYRRERARDKREEARKESIHFLIRVICAIDAMGEETAKAVQRMDKECNGDMTRALEYARKVKQKHREFLQKHGIDNLH